MAKELNFREMELFVQARSMAKLEQECQLSDF